MPTSNVQTILTLLTKHDIAENLVLVRMSSRARRLLFKSSIKKGVEIVVPRGASSSWVIEMVEARILWIKSAQLHVKEGREQLNPTLIDLKALDEIWTVDYKSVAKFPRGMVVNRELELTVGVDDKDVFYTVRKLQAWLRVKAKASLEPWLTRLAENRGMKFNRISVRNQVSRWGSCSEKRNISLNQNLMFLPAHLVEYVLHHELTHLDQMNHSRKFWNSFSCVLPTCRALRREIGTLNPDDIPLWASPGLNRV